MLRTSRQIVLASRPAGEPTAGNFRLEEITAPVPGEGEVLLRTMYFSLDPYMRGRMNAGPSYAAPTELGEVMGAGSVSEVLESNDPGFVPGDEVLAYTGWQEYAVAPAKTLRKLDSRLAPVTTALGVLGMPGMTAYTGLLNIGQPKAGETVVVAAAAGAVGSAVGQIAKIYGCRAVGVAGGPEKCAYVVEQLGFDACIDHRAADFAVHLKAACPAGVDVYFENVGGAVLGAVFPLLNNFGRMPVCGLIAHYNGGGLTGSVNRVPQLMATVLTKRLRLQGFIVSDYNSQMAEFLERMGSWVRGGQVKYREDVVEGLENAVEAFQGLLHGRNSGKLLVRVGSAT